MGKRADEVLEIADLDGLADHLSINHSVYMDVDGRSYYLTDVNSHYWRAQDTTRFNEKGHYCDCSALVPTLSEFMAVDFIDGRTIPEVIAEATFHASTPGVKVDAAGEEVEAV